MKKVVRYSAGWLVAIGLLHVLPAGAQIIIDEDLQPRPSTGERAAIPVPAPGSSVATSGDKPAASGDTAVVKFLNEDRLHGMLMAIEPAEYGLRWQSSVSLKPVDLRLDAISSLSLPRGQARPAKTTASVKLTNGDTWGGNVVLLDKEKLVLEAWYCGEVSIRRSMLKTIMPGERATTVIFEGPGEMKSWITRGSEGVGSWILRNGVLCAVNEYPIGRYIENLPDMAQMEFEMGWRGYPDLYFWFYANNLEQMGQSGCYLVRMSSGQIYIMCQTPNGGQRNMGQVEVPELANRQGGKIRICILVSKKDKRFILMANGRVLREFQDTEAFAGSGNGIQFQSQRQCLMNVRNIRISEWDGSIPKPAAAEEVRKADFVELVNGDKISGTLKGIADGKIRIETRFGDMDIPFERVHVIQLSSEGVERARRNKSDVKAVFANGGQVTMELVRVADGKMEGRSENFGSVKMPVEAFRLLEFNIYRERTASDDDEATVPQAPVPSEMIEMK